MKFHPDKNEGDDFFIERFKEILEAYETLIDDSRREEYDLLLSKRRFNTDYSNFLPIVEFFKANKTSFSFDDEITFSWKTINADHVVIKPFGKVPSIGEKTYKIKDFKNPHVNFFLIAENSRIGKQASTKITIHNSTYSELFEHFKKKIELENQFKSKLVDKESSEKNPNQGGTKYFNVGAIIVVLIILYIISKL